MRFNPSVTDVARNFADYINRVAFRGEHFILMRGKRAVAELRPVPVGKHLRELPELLASLPRLSEAEATLLSEDWKSARTALNQTEARNPWES